MPAKNSSPKLLPPDLYALTDGDKDRALQEEDLGMVSPGSQVLQDAAKPVDSKLIKTPLIQEVIRALFLAAGSQQKTSKQGKAHRMLVGLAAPQIGESWRIVVIDTKVTPDRKNGGQLECFVDPEIVWRSREVGEGREGCFSAGPVWGLVRRSVAVKVKAFTPSGERIERIFEGFTARIIQHEIDHLDGIRFPDRIKSDKKRHWVHAEEIAFYPENIQRWPRICTLDRWEALKQGKIEL